MLITDTAVHPLEYFDEYFSQVYTPREVSAQSFAADIAAGLWTYSGDVVLAAAESLVFRYYTPDNVLIKSESVSIVSDGKNAVAMTSPTTPPGSYTGQIGMYAGHFYQWNGSEWILQDTATTADVAEYTPRYLGMFASYPTDAHAGDWCVLSGNGILYLYTGASWQAITDYADSRYTRLFMSAMGDLFALAKNTGEQLFVSRLVALTAFIQTLFSKQIVISSDGTISSENFSSGSEGFRIQGNGTAEFNNGIFNKGSFADITVNRATFNNIKINNTQNIFTNVAGSNLMTFADFLNSIVTKYGVSCFGSLVATFADSNTTNTAEFKTLLFWPDDFTFLQGELADFEGNFILLDEKNQKTYDEDDPSIYYYKLLYYIPMICRGHFYITKDMAQLIFKHYPTTPEGAPNISNKTININLKKQNYIACRLCY